MKHILLCLLLLVCTSIFSQDKKTIISGYITFNSGSIVNFKNLTIEDKEIKYLNEVSQREMTFSLGAVKKIVDNTGDVVYESIDESKVKNNSDVKQVAIVREKRDEEKLVYISSNKIMLNQSRVDKEGLKVLLEPVGIYSAYKEGKKQAGLGGILIGGGIGLFVGGGVSNLINANNGGGGSPAVLIVGIATSLVGIPVRLSGTKKIKYALERYNNMPAANRVSLNNTNLKVVAGSGGLGVQLQF